MEALNNLFRRNTEKKGNAYSPNEAKAALKSRFDTEGVTEPATEETRSALLDALKKFIGLTK
ncbi:hypothetical protein HOH87_05160 [bacterium]|jgi:hypothetical protein|nr:hypothetical protein [bacterium]